MNQTLTKNQLLYLLATSDDQDEYECLALLLLFEYGHFFRLPNVYLTFAELEQEYDNTYIKRTFRFSLSGLRRLHSVLLLPDFLVCSVKTDFRYALSLWGCWLRFLLSQNGTKASSEEALLVLLFRLSSPDSLHRHKLFLRRSESEISQLTNAALLDIHSKWSFLLDCPPRLFSPARLRVYARAVAEKASIPEGLFNPVGFVDGTARWCAQPGRGLTDACFNGHENHTCLKYCALALPDGLLGFCYGPLEGARHDSAVSDHFGVVERLRPLLAAAGDRFCVFGDVAYRGDNDILIPPFRESYVGNGIGKQEFNKLHKRVRKAVEWLFNVPLQLFPLLDRTRTQQLLRSPLSLQYRVAALLSDAYVCLNGGELSSYFLVAPPPLEEFFQRGSW